MEIYRAHQCLWTQTGVEGATYRRVAVFASFDKYYRLSPVALYWLKALEKVCDAVVFVTDHAIAGQDEEELRRHVVHYECRRHGEYDFGSYKRGYLFLKESGLLENADELLFCNDSCYGPMKPLEDIFADYARHPGYGMYGLTHSYDGFHYPVHVQSFFMLFPSRVFSSGYFENFMCGVRHEPEKMDVVRRYEVGLSVLLRQQGEKCYTFDHMPGLYSPTCFHWRRFLGKCGLLKRNLLPEWASHKTVAEAVAARCDYPVGYITASAGESAVAVILKDLPEGGEGPVRIIDCRSGNPPKPDANPGRTICLISPYMGADVLDEVLEAPVGVCAPSSPTPDEFVKAVHSCLDGMGAGSCCFQLGDGGEIYNTAAALCGELGRRESAKPPKAPVPTCAFRRGMRIKWLKTRIKNTLLWGVGIFY